MIHVGNPGHLPGMLYDCTACEQGPCTCDPETDGGCVSIHCRIVEEDS